MPSPSISAQKSAGAATGLGFVSNIFNKAGQQIGQLPPEPSVLRLTENQSKVIADRLQKEFGSNIPKHDELPKLAPVFFDKNWECNTGQKNVVLDLANAYNKIRNATPGFDVCACVTQDPMSSISCVPRKLTKEKTLLRRSFSSEEITSHKSFLTFLDRNLQPLTQKYKSMSSKPSRA